MKTRRKTLLLSMRRYAHDAGVNSGAEDRAGKVTAHASLSAATRIGCKGSDSEDKMIVVEECQTSRQIFIFKRSAPQFEGSRHRLL